MEKILCFVIDYLLFSDLLKLRICSKTTLMIIQNIPLLYFIPNSNSNSNNNNNNNNNLENNLFNYFKFYYKNLFYFYFISFNKYYYNFNINNFYSLLNSYFIQKIELNYLNIIENNQIEDEIVLSNNNNNNNNFDNNNSHNNNNNQNVKIRNKIVIKILKLNYIDCTIKVLFNLCNLSSLQELTLISCPAVNDRVICKLLHTLPLLSYLEISLCFELQKIYCSSELSISPLRTLIIEKCPRFISTTSLTSLIYCNVSMTNITPENLKSLIEINRGLKELTAISCRKLDYLIITSYSLINLNLQRNSSLKTFITYIPTLQTLQLSECYNLTQSDLYINRVTSLDLKMLSKIESLHITSRTLNLLNLTGCNNLNDSIHTILHSIKNKNNSNYYLKQFCTLCNLSFPSCHDPPPSMHHHHHQNHNNHNNHNNESLSSEISSLTTTFPQSSLLLPLLPISLLENNNILTSLNESISIHSIRSFRPTYRCFHSSNLSLCCPFLELKKIIYPFENIYDEKNNFNQSINTNEMDGISLKVARRLTM